VDDFSTVLSFETMATQLVEEIENSRKNLPSTATYLAHFRSREEVENWVSDFCYFNAEVFVLENYPL
jgi:hypothetical protein